MLELFNSGVLHYAPYIAILVMLVVIHEFYVSGSWRYDKILLVSLTGATIGMVLCVMGPEPVSVQTVNAVIFVGVYNVVLTLYSMHFRRKQTKR